jgi:cytoskeletal protein RodZ
MHFIIEMLRSQPILILVLSVWIIGAISNAVQQQRRQQQKQKKQQPEKMSQQRPAPRRPTAEEVAAEMRRALGLDPKPEKAPAKPPARSPRPPDVRPPPRPVAPAPVSPLPRALSKVEARAPSVGERMEARPAPASGAVGAQAPGSQSLGTQSLGSLGGRAGARAARRPRGGSALVDLRDLPRAFVMREVLDPPLALREPRV